VQIAYREVMSPDPETLTRIGRLRVEVWRDEGSLADEIVARGEWTDDSDLSASHWLAKTAGGQLVAAGRLALHESLAGSLDGFVWQRAGRTIPLPLASISRLVVAREARGHGIASELNRLRVEAAKARGARCVTVTASVANARLLERIGFVDTGLVVQFDNRPGVVFHALELRFAIV